MVRNLFGLLLALAGAAAAAWSPFRAWYQSRDGRYFRLQELFSGTGITDTRADLWTGLFLPMAAAAVLTLIAALLRSRLLVALTGLLVLGFTALWMVRQGQAAGSLTAGGDGLGEGVGLAAGGGLLLLVGALVMRGRHGGTRRRGAHARIDDGDRPEPYDDHAPSESPNPYGPFGTTHGPHGAYQADDLYGLPPGRHDDATPAEEWDPWSRPAPQQPPPDQPYPPQGPQQQGPQPPPGPPPGAGPSGTQHIPRRPDQRGDGPY
ncbi:hypothetical protein ACFPA8_09885 [Streptomyces ovatisporus]|uniref:Integral membrane protein n=1 Tax=Streptomyces ovatisporus TaxID=1128682 RepID=A0ABV9AA15_9ACTN